VVGPPHSRDRLEHDHHVQNPPGEQESPLLEPPLVSGLAQDERLVDHPRQTLPRDAAGAGELLGPFQFGTGSLQLLVGLDDLVEERRYVKALFLRLAQQLDLSPVPALKGIDALGGSGNSIRGSRFNPDPAREGRSG